MSKGLEKEIKGFLEKVALRDPHEKTFSQAVEEVIASIMPVYLENKIYRENAILERMVEPERVIQFRVPWQDDKGAFHVNRGYRVQFNHAIGPYKGGLRFHPSVNLSILKFLGFEQTFKNALTGLPMGGGKGGSDFDPKGKSDHEVMRFCQSFMNELFRHVGESTDVPAGDIGVGTREIGYLFGQYMRLKNQWAGVFTGKGLSYGGSLLRPEATGYGCIYFCQNLLEHRGDSLEGKTIGISGSGNVAVFAAEKAMQLGGKVITLSDSEGTVVFKNGISEKLLGAVKTLKFENRGRLSELKKSNKDVEYRAKANPWSNKMDVCMPCATQNEILEADAKELVKNKVQVVCEGANMPCHAKAAELFVKNKIAFAPGKASNAGGVSVSGLEQSQNAMRLSWSAEEVDQKLKGIMKNIHDKCVAHGQEKTYLNYINGANIAGFQKVADAMLAYGCV